MSESGSNADSDNDLKISDPAEEPNFQSPNQENPDSDDENESLADSIQSPPLEQKQAATNDEDEEADDKSPQKLSDDDDDDQSDAEAENDNFKKSKKQLLSQEALFGDGADVSSSDEEHASVEQEDEEERGDRDESKSPAAKADNDTEAYASNKEIDTEREPTGRFPGEDEEDQEEEAEQPETIIEVDIPKISLDLGKQTHFVKFPNFLSVEPRPFDADAYEDEVDEDEILDEEGRARLKLKVENTIRWRNSIDAEGNPIRDSNAKIVRWSDGSMSLQLGSEIFDIHTHPLQGDHNHLFLRLGTGLQAQSIFKTKLTFRPHSTESVTHRKMTLSMADRSSRAQKVKVLPVVGKDPEQQKQEMIKKEEERLRATHRRESQQRRMRERMSGRGISAPYLEEEDDENTISISAIKNRYRQGGSREFRAIYSSESEESEAGGRRLEHAKMYDSDEGPSGSKRKKPKVIEDDDEED